MALGTFGSTLNDELNRLANGGTYRTMGNMVDEALAAKQWANRENIVPYSTDTVGILNEIAGLGTNRQNWLDFNGVCNYIAGTTGLPAAAALRQVYNTTDLLTSQSAYYVDATDASASTQTLTNLGTAGSLLPTTLGSSTASDSNDPLFLPFTGTNYVYTPGVTGASPYNYMSVPDAASLDITGDIDLRARVALDDWTPSAEWAILSKEFGAGTRSYMMTIQTDGTIKLYWSADGTNWLNAASTTLVGAADGSVKWIRATLDVDNGASGRTIEFFTSDDGTTWTKLGNTVTQANTTSIFSGTALLAIAQYPSSGWTPAAKFYRIQVLNGIGGTTVLDVDTSVITAGSATSFTAVTGQTVTINRSTSGRKTVAVTQPTWLFGTDDYMEVNNRYMASGTYLYLPGVASNNATAPDSAALDITGDIDLRVKVALDDWTPSALQYLLSKYQSASQRSYGLNIGTNGRPNIVWSTDGTATGLLAAEATVAPTVADGATLWIRATLDVDNGASGKTVTFYTSDDGTAWTQLGTAVTTAGTTSIFASTSQLEIGSVLATSNPARGKFFRAQVLNGINGTVAFDANFETSITSLNQATFTESSANGATVTINRSGSAYRSAGITGTAGYLYPGATNTFTASAIDYLNFGAADSFTFLVVHRQWDTAATTAIIGNRTIVSGTVTPGYWFATTTFSGGVNRTFAGISGQVTSVATTSTDANVAWVNGVLNTHIATVNRSTNLLSLTKNAGTPATASISGITTSSTNFDPFRIGANSPTIGNYATMTLNAVAVFRTALTTAQIRQISNYFANREAYL